MSWQVNTPKEGDPRYEKHWWYLYRKADNWDQEDYEEWKYGTEYEVMLLSPSGVVTAKDVPPTREWLLGRIIFLETKIRNNQKVVDLLKKTLKETP